MIMLAEAKNLRDAWVFAIEIGCGPTLFATINLTCAPSASCPDPVVRLSKIRDRAKSFMRRHGVSELVWLEVRENPGGNREHAHWAVYVPPHLRAAFIEALAGWVAIDAYRFDRRAVVVKPITWWVGLMRYLLKGASGEVRRLFFVPARSSPFQGVVDGPRVRVSHSIGATARKAAQDRQKGASEARVANA